MERLRAQGKCGGGQYSFIAACDCVGDTQRPAKLYTALGGPLSCLHGAEERQSVCETGAGMARLILVLRGFVLTSFYA